MVAFQGDPAKGDRRIRMKARCYRCAIDTFHPWHDDGTPHEPDMQTVKDSYINGTYIEGEYNDRR